MNGKLWANFGTDLLHSTLGLVNAAGALTAPSTTLLTGPSLDERYTTTTGTTTNTFLTDLQHSTVGLVDSAGSLTSAPAYTPYGASTAPGPATPPSSTPARRMTAPGSITTAPSTIIRSGAGLSAAIPWALVAG